MISDPVDRWKRRIGENSWITYKVYWRKFLKFTNTTEPAELLKLSKQEAADLVETFYDDMKQQGLSSTTCHNCYTIVRSFFVHNGLELGKFPKKFGGEVQYEEGYRMTQQEVYELIEAIQKWHYKFWAGVCFQGGQRVSICAALKFKHIETRNWQNARVVIFKVPAFLLDSRGKNVNKWRIKYRFALLDDTIRYLQFHVKERKLDGEEITSESWLIVTRHNKPPQYKCMTNIVKLAAVKIGIQSYTTTAIGQKKSLIHPHVGRIYFKAQLRQAGVDPDLRNFMMGHKLPYGGAYDKFDEAEIVEAMERSRLLLAIAPKVVTDVEWQKKRMLAQGARFMPPEKLIQLESLMKYATTQDELDKVLEEFKNGRVKLKSIR